MNSEHRLACQGLENEHYERWILTTEDIGTPSYMAAAFAKAFIEALKTEVECFKGKKEGQLKGERLNSAPPKGREAAHPKSICPRCLKGFHWKKHCRSKYDKDGKPILPLNSRKGNPQPKQ